MPSSRPPDPGPSSFDPDEDLSDLSVDERFERAIELFNEGYYFEFHDVLEDLWREDESEERNFYQGLLQAGVSLHKTRLGQMEGARKLLDKGRARLAGYRPRHRGVEVDQLIRDIEAFVAEAERRDQQGLSCWPDRDAPRIASPG